jgi:hypothetical protein
LTCSRGCSAALRAIERYRDVLPTDAGDRLDHHIGETDVLGWDARYLAAVAAPEYESAFIKMIRDPSTGHLRFSPKEVRDGPIVGLRQASSSAMVTTTTSGSRVMLAGDFQAGYLIGDRLGFHVELVPQLFGAANRFPTRQRGVLAIWWTGVGSSSRTRCAT